VAGVMWREAQPPPRFNTVKTILMAKTIRHYKQRHLRGTTWTRIASTRGKVPRGTFFVKEECYEKQTVLFSVLNVHSNGTCDFVY
jgi:hypothetical protein